MAEKSRWLEDKTAGQIASVVMKKKMRNPRSQLSFSHFGFEKSTYFTFDYVLYVYMHACVCSAHGEQKGKLDPLELVTFVSH